MPVKLSYLYLTLASLHTNTDTFADSADPDETAPNCLLQSFDWNPYLQQWMRLKSEIEESI